MRYMRAINLRDILYKNTGEISKEI